MIMNTTTKDLSYFFIKSFSLGFPKNREDVKRFNLETESHKVESKSSGNSFYFYWEFKDEFSMLLTEKDSVQNNYIYVKTEGHTGNQVEGMLGRLSPELKYVDSDDKMSDIIKEIGGDLVSTG